MSNIKVEIGQYRPVDKGALRGFFSVVLFPGDFQEQKLIDCRHFEQGDKSWISWPQKEIKFADGRKSDYYPYINYVHKDYSDKIKSAIIEALKNARQGNDDHSKNQANQKQENPLQGDTSSLWFQ